MFMSVVLPAPFSPSSARPSRGYSASSIRALATAPGKTLTMPRSSTSAAGRAPAITRSLRVGRGSVDPLNEPTSARDVLEAHHLTGGDAEIALLVLDRSFEDLQLAADDVLLGLVDHLPGRVGNRLVQRRQRQEAVGEAAVVVLGLELTREDRLDVGLVERPPVVDGTGQERPGPERCHVGVVADGVLAGLRRRLHWRLRILMLADDVGGRVDQRPGGSLLLRRVVPRARPDHLDLGLRVR